MTSPTTDTGRRASPTMQETILGLALITVGATIAAASVAYATAVWAGHLTGSNLTDFRASLFIAGVAAIVAATGLIIAI